MQILKLGNWNGDLEDSHEIVVRYIIYLDRVEQPNFREK